MGKEVINPLWIKLRTIVQALSIARLAGLIGFLAEI